MAPVLYATSWLASARTGVACCRQSGSGPWPRPRMAQEAPLPPDRSPKGSVLEQGFGLVRPSQPAYRQQSSSIVRRHVRVCLITGDYILTVHVRDDSLSSAGSTLSPSLTSHSLLICTVGTTLGQTNLFVWTSSETHRQNETSLSRTAPDPWCSFDLAPVQASGLERRAALPTRLRIRSVPPTTFGLVN